MASAASASDPFIGTWKLDPGKSKYSSGAPPREMTIQIDAEGDNLRIAAHGADEDGSPLSVMYSLPDKGGNGQVQHGFFDSVGSAYISVDVRHTTYLKDGKEMMSRRTVLSDQGRTMRSSVKGTNAKGHPVAGEEVYERIG